ncbi:MAG: hypothetical protein AAGB19_08895 [Cyanobacteria bacterium P01_F01_bin.3]
MAELITVEDVSHTSLVHDRIEEELGEAVEQEVRSCTANPVDQSHRRIKHQCYLTLGFDEVDAAQKFCRAVDEVGHFLKPRSRMTEFVSLENRRQCFLKSVEELMEFHHHEN